MLLCFFHQTDYIDIVGQPWPPIPPICLKPPNHSSENSEYLFRYGSIIIIQRRQTSGYCCTIPTEYPYHCKSPTSILSSTTQIHRYPDTQLPKEPHFPKPAKSTTAQSTSLLSKTANSIFCPTWPIHHFHNSPTPPTATHFAAISNHLFLHHHTQISPKSPQNPPHGLLQTPRQVPQRAARQPRPPRPESRQQRRRLRSRGTNVQTAA